MIPLTEDLTKAWLRRMGLPVPRGYVARSPGDTQADGPPAGPLVVKALVPTGRRGKAGAVVATDDAAQLRAATERLLGAQVNGHRVRAVYIEERIAIAAEYYVSFFLQSDQAEILISMRGGVDIEHIAREESGALVRERIDPLSGLSPWSATELWIRAGLEGPVLPRVADATSRLYEAFRDADALLLEINPLVVDSDQRVCLVGAMMGIDDNALFRHTDWLGRTTVLPGNPRERAVALADRSLAGGPCQYIELDGDIGLLVGGGGAGLYQHDLVLELGGRPANHCITPPTSADTGKLKAVLAAIFDNPAAKGLLIGFNFAQMARADIRIRALIEVLDERNMDTTDFPIVVRLFGAGEHAARAMIGQRPNIHYLPRGASLKDAVELIVQLTAAQRSPAVRMNP